MIIHTNHTREVKFEAPIHVEINPLTWGVVTVLEKDEQKYRYKTLQSQWRSGILCNPPQ